MTIDKLRGVRLAAGWSHHYLLKSSGGQQVADFGIPSQGLVTPGEIAICEKAFEAGLLAMAKALGHDKATIEVENPTGQQRAEP